jgi:hypothetical protein
MQNFQNLGMFVITLEYIFLLPSRNNTTLWCAFCSRYARMLTYLEIIYVSFSFLMLKNMTKYSSSSFIQVKPDNQPNFPQQIFINVLRETKFIQRKKLGIGNSVVYSTLQLIL